MKGKTQHIPAGYKLSPLGPIPENWEVKRLGEIAEISSGTTPLRANIDFYSNGNIPWVKTTDLNNGVLTSTEELITNKALEKTSLRLLPKGTVLVAMYGGFNQIGRTAMLGIEATINQALSALICNEEIYDSFLLAWLNCKVKEWKHLAASSRKDPNITGKDVARFPIAVPPTDEQHRIVSVLQLWDTAIEKQTQLVEKLTLRKRGLMQQLLTGKKRLKGFSGEWKEVRLGEILRETNELVGSRDIKPVSVGLLGIRLRSDVFDKELSSDYAKNKVLTKNQICFGLGTNQIVFDVLLSNNTYCVSPAYRTFCIEKCNPLLFKSLLSIYTSYISKKHMIISARQGKSVDFDGLLSERIHIPTDKEQNAIASVLVNADKEIEIQKQKLSSLQEQKKELMQVLLSGKRRVKIN